MTNLLVFNTQTLSGALANNATGSFSTDAKMSSSTSPSPRPRSLRATNVQIFSIRWTSTKTSSPFTLSTTRNLITKMNLDALSGSPKAQNTGETCTWLALRGDTAHRIGSALELLWIGVLLPDHTNHGESGKRSCLRCQGENHVDSTETLPQRIRQQAT